MWLFLVGSKDYNDRLGFVVATCPDCGTRSLFTVEQQRKKFTVYTIPTFQFSKKQYMVCPACREVFEVADELKEEISQKLISQDELAEKIRQGKVEQLLKPARKSAGRRRKKSRE